MLFEGNLDMVSESSEAVVLWKIFEQGRMEGGGGRAPQGAKFESQRLQTLNNNVLVL